MIPELYLENLDTLKRVIRDFELIRTEGLFELEIYIRIDDVDSWAVIGYGESGDPCVLRWETTTDE